MIIVQQNMYVRRGAEKLHRSRKKAAVNQKLPGKLCISPLEENQNIILIGINSSGD